MNQIVESAGVGSMLFQASSLGASADSLFGDVMKTKTCTKCREEKLLSEFTKNNKSKDGLQFWCKACFGKYTREHKEVLKEYSRKHYIDNLEYYSTRSYNYYRNNSEESKKRACEYYQNNKISIKARHKSYRVKYPARVKARGAVQYALIVGKLTRPDVCSKCKEKRKLVAHHWSYLPEHWLDVIWLCYSCHGKIHAAENQ